AAIEFEQLAANDFFDLPKDGDWLISMTLLADLAAGLRDAPRARLLYDLLLPYRERNIVIGMATVCLGSLARYVGRLALAIGERTAAVEHLQLAIEANTALTAPVQLAHTQVDLAQALGPGPEALAMVEAARLTADDLHLPAVTRRLEQL
ncbi:MAG: guanylate cyclase, partial [Solirubrobacteraceae bacterium]